MDWDLEWIRREKRSWAPAFIFVFLTVGVMSTTNLWPAFPAQGVSGSKPSFSYAFPDILSHQEEKGTSILSRVYLVYLLESLPWQSCYPMFPPLTSENMLYNKYTQWPLLLGANNFIRNSLLSPWSSWYLCHWCISRNLTHILEPS